ncbi:MAG: hypothetical protein Q4F69_11505 [Bacteroidia bacterium]|nr:hypothetical protein [Bacteroidia bacterium]
MKSDMYLGVYSFYDLKNKLFAPPFTEFSKVDACRRFDAIRHDERSVVSRYPSDFEFYKLCEINLSTGAITECKELLDVESFV